MDNAQQKTLARIGSAGGVFLLLLLLPAQGWVRAALYLIPYGIAGWDVLFRAARNIKNGQVFDENFLMAVASLGAFACGEYPEGVAVLLFYQVGEFFQDAAVGRSRRSIAALMEIRPDYANVEREGQLLRLDPEEAAVGDVIVLRPGERVPLDSRVLEGRSALDTAALTGEPLPRDVGPGDSLPSGCVNVSGLLRARVERPFGQSTVARILELVESAAEKKSKTEHFITRFARYYTPGVVLAALMLAILPPLLGGGDWLTWVRRALTFLVVSCPCALVISVPLTFFGGIGGASRQGILVKGGNYLEALADTGVVVLDKTGTLTTGVFAVSAVCPVGMDADALLELAALAEQFSSHPISQSIRQACPVPLDPQRVGGVQELAGRGLCAQVDGRTVLAGNPALLEEFGVPVPNAAAAGGEAAQVFLAVEGVYAGYLAVTDTVKPGAAQALRELKAAGVRRTVMLTGDAEAPARRVAQALGLDQVCARLLPGDKVSRVEELLSERRGRERLLFVGDGINDAPVLSRADIGAAMGGLGSDAAIEAADVVLMDDDLRKLPVALRIARKTMAVARQNIVLALGVKFGVLALSSVGLAGMWAAVFADVGVTILAVCNAGRMLRVK